tara:strand:- start:2460 stop:2720 length:261 start_codon:yes stop_codon:yes gene_type:complete
MIYKVDLDITKVRQSLVKAHVLTYTSNTAVVFVDAEDPDDACNQGMEELKVKVLDHYNSTEVQEIVKSFDNEVSVKTIRKITPYEK